MAQWVKCLWSSYCASIRSPVWRGSTCLSAWAVGWRRQAGPQAHWPASLAESVSSRSAEIPCLKNQGRKSNRRRHPPSTSGLHKQMYRMVQVFCCPLLATIGTACHGAHTHMQVKHSNPINKLFFFFKFWRSSYCKVSLTVEDKQHLSLCSHIPI